MKTTLSINEIERINTSYSSRGNKLNNYINFLTNGDFGEQPSGNLSDIMDQDKTSFYKRMDKEKKEYLQILSATAITVLGSIGPIWSISSEVWYVVSTISAIILGYWGFKNKIAGAICGLLMNCILYFVVSYCLKDDTNSLYIFIIVPIFFTLAPTFLLYRLLAKIILYKKV
ncbi:MAG: hypothetical protein EOO91_04750 [Pedobacter sp.]|nr:MAG: hypothetical protein EOO91_04750 [Pedobacter sp.]